MQDKLIVRTLSRFVDHYDSIHHVPRNTLISGLDAFVDEHYKLAPLPFIFVVDDYPFFCKRGFPTINTPSPVLSVKISQHSPQKTFSSDGDVANYFDSMTRENTSTESLIKYAPNSTYSED